MPDPDPQQNATATPTPPPDAPAAGDSPTHYYDSDSKSIKKIGEDKPETLGQKIWRNLTPEKDSSRAALGPEGKFSSEPTPQESGEALYKENFGSPLERAYGHAKRFEKNLSEKVLQPFREGADRIGDELQEAGETGHTRSGGQLTGPTRALVGTVGELMKQVPVGRDVKSTVQALAVPPELGPEGKINLEGIEHVEISPAPKPGAKAPNLEGIEHVEVSPAPGKRTAKPLPPQPRLPDTGTHAAIKTDDGSIYFDNAPEKQRTHIMLAQDLGLPPERVVSGGWLSDGHYEASARSDAGKWGEQARAKAAVSEKRTAKAADSQSEQPSIFTPEGAKPLADKLGAKVVGSVATGKTSPDPYGINRGPKDLDLRIEGAYDSEKTEAAMREQGFEPSGSSVVSPEEVKKSGKDYGGPGWKRIEHFQDQSGKRVDIFHDEPQANQKSLSKALPKNPSAHQKLFDEATAALGSETKKTAARTTLNASGESAASQEAINRAASEKAQGVKRFRIDSRSGKETPLFGPDAVDAKPGPYDYIVSRDSKGQTVLDMGRSAFPLRRNR
jgi:hypothetical protein